MEQLNYYELHLFGSDERILKTWKNCRAMLIQVLHEPLTEDNQTMRIQLNREIGALEQIMRERELF